MIDLTLLTTPARSMERMVRGRKSEMSKHNRLLKNTHHLRNSLKPLEATMEIIAFLLSIGRCQAEKRVFQQPDKTQPQRYLKAKSGFDPFGLYQFCRHRFPRHWGINRGDVFWAGIRRSEL
jgi:hypothetical protein